MAKDGEQRALKEWENNFPNWQEKRKQEIEDFETEFHIPKYK